MWVVLHNHPQCQDEVVLPVEGQGEVGHIAFRRLQRFHKWRGACPVMGCKPIAMERAEDMSMLLPCGRSLLRAAAQEYGFPPQEPQMEPGVFYGYQNRVAPNLDSSDKNPPMSYALPEATPQMKNEQVLAVNPQGTVRSISPSGYEDSGRLTVNAAWAPKGWFQVNATGRLHRMYGDQVNRG